MVDDRAICARDLVLAIFRLAVADRLGISYGHDDPASKRVTRSASFAPEAAVFLASPWAAHLADLAGFSLRTVWRHAQSRSSWLDSGRVEDCLISVRGFVRVKESFARLERSVDSAPDDFYNRIKGGK